MPEYERPYPHLLDEIDRLRARAEAAEARIDHALRELREHRVAHAVAFLTGEHDDALRGEGDLAAEVTGLCDEHADYGACPDSCREGDRPAADHVGIFDGPPAQPCPYIGEPRRCPSAGCFLSLTCLRDRL